MSWKLTHGHKIILEAVKDLNALGVTDISNRTLAEKTGLNETTVINYLRYLENRGDIEREHIQVRNLKVL